MSETTKTVIIESATQSNITAIAFTADGCIFGGDEGGEIHRWKIEDAHHIGPTMKASGFVESAVVSKDGRWLVTGDDGHKGIVWNAQTHEKVLEVTEHTHFVYAVDVPTDSIRFASGSCDKTVRIFSITTGVRLIPPLRHDHAVIGVKFSPGGDRLAAATYDVCVCIYDSYTGDRLFNVPVRVMHAPTTPFAWSSDGQELFVVSPGKITCLDTSDSSRVEWSTHNNRTRASIVTNGAFVACSAGSSVSLWDNISHQQIGLVIEHAPSVFCISLSKHEKFLACGHGNKISIHSLIEILPDLYIPSHPSLSSSVSHPLPIKGTPEPSLGTITHVTELCSKHVSSAQKREVIEDAVQKVFKHSPLVLIDVTTGRLCDRHLLPELFRADPTFDKLVSSMAGEIDKEHIQKTVKEYFGYVMLSHVWGNGKEEEKDHEPSFKSVKLSGSIRGLPNTPLNNKLRNFCAKVTELGYRWAWSDTCCIDKSNDAILSRSLRSMYRWYEDAAATLVFLADVSSDHDGLLHSHWMTRAWTLQEAFAPKRMLFYDRDWMFYRDIVADNHKQPGVILQELANAIGVSSQTLVSFHPDSLTVREKLRLSSTRSASVEEDVAYSLIGIFKSRITPRYGEGEDALGHLLEETVAHSGDVTVLAWTGNPSPYNSCLPSTLAVYSREPYTPLTLKASDMESRTNHLLNTLSKEKVLGIYRQILDLPPVRFANRRLQLPCILFRARSLGMRGRGNHGNHYRATVSGLGTMEFTTTDRLPLAEPWRLVFVHPWITDVRGLHDEGGAEDSDTDTEVGSEREVGRNAGMEERSETTPSLSAIRPPPMDEHALALQMIVRLGQPFNALSLLRQPGGEYKRVAAENEIIVQISDNYTRSKDIRAEVVDVL